MSEENLERRMGKFAVDQAELRWIALRVDDAVIELHEDVREIKAAQQRHAAQLEAMNSDLQSMTQMLGQVLDRLPEK